MSFSTWRINIQLFRAFRVLLATALIGALGTTAHAAITFVPSAEYPEFPDVFTGDPLLNSPAGRNVAAARMLRQTFKVPETITIGEIVISLSIGEGNEAAGLGVSFFEVEDVNAGSWMPVGDAVYSFEIPELMASTARTGFVLTDADVFELPARGINMDDMTGYGIEVNNLDMSSNLGGWQHSNNSENDHYLDGRYYTESGGGDAYRDFGLSLLSTDAEPPMPGDVNNDTMIDLADLEIIRMNFRQSVNSRGDGDLNGDGFVDFVDFRNWKNNYPDAFDGTGVATAVPEPASALLAAMGLLAMLGAGRRNR